MVVTCSFGTISCFGDKDLELDGESDSGGVNGYSNSDSEVVAAVSPAAWDIRVRRSKDNLKRIPISI